MRRVLLLSISILPLLLLGTTAQAADAPVAECGFTGIVEGGAGYQGGNVSVNTDRLGLPGNFLGFGETAIGYGCGNWMAQLDGALYHSGVSERISGTQVNVTDKQGHIGGAVMLRDVSVGRFGLAASEILNNTHGDAPGFNFDIGGSLTRGGVFGDYYASDAITLGAGGFYVTGRPIDGFGSSVTESGFEGNIHAKFYATDNISLTLQGDLQRANFTSNVVNPWNGYAGSIEAEYLVPSTALSLFVGGLTVSRTLEGTGSSSSTTFDDTHGYIGLKWAFGAPITSLRARDRAGPYDNTSVFDEKLPNIYYDALSAGLL